jgi:hypothetical protein
MSRSRGKGPAGSDAGLKEGMDPQLDPLFEEGKLLDPIKTVEV